MEKKILQIGAPVLRQRAREVMMEEIFSDSFQQLLNDMRDIMRAAPGVGLAAPQIGIPLQVAVIEDKSEYHQALSQEQLKIRERVPVDFHVLINPRITSSNPASNEFFEGCLSMKGFVGIVPRASKVQVEYLNKKAEPVTLQASGWYARILQHEIEHLGGCLFIDKVKYRSLMTVDNYINYWKDKLIEDVCCAFR